MDGVHWFGSSGVKPPGHLAVCYGLKRGTLVCKHGTTPLVLKYGRTRLFVNTTARVYKHESGIEPTFANTRHGRVNELITAPVA